MNTQKANKQGLSNKVRLLFNQQVQFETKPRKLDSFTTLGMILCYLSCLPYR